MSSTTGLSRTRSLRKPPAGGDQLGHKESASASKEARNASPSRLPQVRPLTRSVAASASTHTRAPSSTTGRPLSGVFTGRTATTRRPSPTTERASAAAPKPLGRAPSTRQPPPQVSAGAGAARREPSRREPTSTSRPTSSAGPSSSAAPHPRAFGHSRAKSTAAALTDARTIGHSRARSTATALTAATTLRPPAATPLAASTISAKLQTRSQTHTRNASQSSAQPAAAALAHRPAFNTNQQHYSPLKSLAPKPLTSTYLAPPSPSKLPSNVALSAETSRLQTELLQLSLLHRDAGAVGQQWHESARSKLGARFARLARENDELGAAERDRAEGRNAAALVRWGQQGSVGLEEKVQLLDQVLNGVWSLSEPGGRYSRVVQGFEKWAERVAGILAAQRSGNVDELVAGDEVMFLGELEMGWKGECGGLVRKLDGWRTTLRELGDAPDAPKADGAQRSSLAGMLDGCRALVHDMLAELAVMEQIEHEARSAEEQWIEKTNEELRLDDTQDSEVPLWKLVI